MAGPAGFLFYPTPTGLEICDQTKWSLQPQAPAKDELIQDPLGSSGRTCRWAQPALESSANTVSTGNWTLGVLAKHPAFQTHSGKLILTLDKWPI